MSAAPFWTVVQSHKWGVTFPVTSPAGLKTAEFYGEQHRERAQALADELNAKGAA